MLTLKNKIDQRKVKKDGHTDTRMSVRDVLLVKEVQEMELNLPKTCQTHFDDANKLNVFWLYITPDDGYWHGGRFKFRIDVPEEYNIVPPKVQCHTRIWHPNINEDGEVCLSLLRQNSLDSLGWAPTRKLKDVIWGLNSLFSHPRSKCHEDVANMSRGNWACQMCRERMLLTFRPSRHVKVVWRAADMSATSCACRTCGVMENDMRNILVTSYNDLLNFDDPLNVDAAEHYERDKDAFLGKVKEYIQKYAKR